MKTTWQCRCGTGQDASAWGFSFRVCGHCEGAEEPAEHLLDGILAALLQLPKERTASVSPSPFVALKGLNSIMRLVPQLITLASGKQFSLQLFKLPEKH
jgi:hypothetical protein